MIHQTNGASSTMLFQQVVTTPVVEVKPIDQILMQQQSPVADVTVSSSEFTNDEYQGNDIALDDDEDHQHYMNKSQNDYGIRNMISAENNGRNQTLPSKYDIPF